MPSKRSLIIIVEETKPSSHPAKLNQLIKDGNSSLLVLRKESLEEEHGIFKAISGLSQISGSLYDQTQ